MADDMTRKGINISSKLEPGQKGKFEMFWDDIAIWDGLNDTLKWSRLYGGALLVVLLEGQDMSTPLKLDRIKEGQFKGVKRVSTSAVLPMAWISKQPAAAITFVTSFPQHNMNLILIANVP